MTRKEAAKLLELIQLAWPKYYKDMPDDKKLATINMWQMSFPDVPYPIIEQAFNHFRMVSKFPPTVAEIVQELKGIYYEAMERASVHSAFCEHDMVSRYQEIMNCTSRYAKGEIGGLNINAIPRLGGVEYARLPGYREEDMR